jgi:hypothetical protein
MAKRSIFRWLLRLGRLVFAFSFVICLLVSLGFAIHTELFIHSAIRADGKVIRLDRRFNEDDKTFQFVPVFEFKADDGKSYTIVSDTATSPPSFTVGQAVQVLYRKGKPDGAVIDSFLELWLVSMILIFIAVADGIISGCWFIVERKLDRKAQGVVLETSLRG